MAAAFSEKLLEGSQIYSWFFGRDLARRRLGRGASHRRDGHQRVTTSTDVGVVCDELLIHDDGSQFNFTPPTGRHAFTSVARQIDEQPLDSVGLHIHVERR